MRTIIAGSRTIFNLGLVDKATRDCGWKITEVVSGHARGVDSIGEKWAKINGVPVKGFPANWGLHGRAAGYKRNVDMGQYAEAAIVIHNGSRGSKMMLDIAKARGLKIYEVVVPTKT